MLSLAKRQALRYTAPVPLTEEERRRLGANLRNARKARGLSQPALARQLEPVRDGGVVSRQVVDQIERGTRGMTVDRLVDLAAALEVPLESLVAGVIQRSAEK